MKKSFFSIFVCFLAILMLFTINSFAFEQEETSVAPCWVSIYDIDLSLGFPGDIGSAAGIASKKPGASRIEGSLYVYENVDGEWEYINSAYSSKTVGGLGITVEFDAESGVEYKAVFVVIVYTNNVPETETVVSIKTCP